MPAPIEDHALIGDGRTAALIGRTGDLDWLCLPRFDSASVFGALLGDERHGRWSLRPIDPDATATREYRDGTFVLVTTWTTSDGVAEVVDLMPIQEDRTDVVRRVRAVSGTVCFRTELRLRFGYAAALPWVRQRGTHMSPELAAAAGPDAVAVRGVRLHAVDHAHAAEFTVGDGGARDLVLTWHPSWRDAPPPLDVETATVATEAWWRDWGAAIEHDGPHHDAVIRSLLILKALTHRDTGGIVAAATTSLPEQFGGERNWDYRYVWLRDASLTLAVLLQHGFRDEADRWRTWLLRAIAGDPEDVQIMYGIAGERYLGERMIASLPGYGGAAPVRVGNGAFTQYQADVIGEVMVALDAARRAGLAETPSSWPLQRALMTFTEEHWQRPDSGIWEMRGAEQHFTQSRVMVWAAFDRAVQAVEEFGLDGPVERWRRLRDEVRDEIEAHGYDRERGSYVQVYGSREVDASLLLLPQVGYLAADDPRMLGTVAAIEADLLREGYVLRYRTEASGDGLPAGENPFLACAFWLAEQYAASGRTADAETLLDRLVVLANDVGLLSEQVDAETGAHAGNTPQALSHLALVRAADALARARR